MAEKIQIKLSEIVNCSTGEWKKLTEEELDKWIRVAEEVIISANGALEQFQERWYLVQTELADLLQVFGTHPVIYKFRHPDGMGRIGNISLELSTFLELARQNLIRAKLLRLEKRAEMMGQEK